MEETQAGDDYMAMGQNRGTLVHIKIDGIYGWEHPTNTLMIIGFDTHPYHSLRTGKSSLKQWIQKDLALINGDFPIGNG